MGTDTKVDLLIECGNSRCKWARSSSAGLFDFGGSGHEELSGAWELYQVWMAGTRPNRILFASVTNLQVVMDAVALLREDAKLTVTAITPCTQAYGIEVAYRFPEKLGVDRWLAMIAARDAYSGPLCIVDAGTAMTLDLVNAKGQHQGGLIIPGVELLKKGLAVSTAQLPLAGEGSVRGRLGIDTEGCITAGSRAALVGAINWVLPSGSDGEPPIGVLCGGNAQEILPWLDGEWHYRPNLVLEGLALISASTGGE